MDHFRRRALQDAIRQHLADHGARQWSLVRDRFLDVPHASFWRAVKGTGNVFRDLGRPDAGLLQLKALLAAGIIRALDDGDLTVRKAESITRIAAADFSRIRNADLGRFTVDRLMTVLNRLGRRVEVAVRVRQKRAAEPHAISA